MIRRPHLDWLRGIAVLIMIEAHTIDSWTRAADRTGPAYSWAVIVAGFGAPAFLFLAGITSMIAAGGRLRRGSSHSDVTRAALRRGAWIFVLAFLFRLQSMAISGGAFPEALLKVDILNVMGLAMLAGAAGLALATTSNRRVWLFAAITVAVAMVTPIIRETPTLDWLPDPLEAYLRPKPGRTNFTLFPWTAFFMGGCVVGACLDSAGDGRRLNWLLAGTGAALAIGGYAASFLPPLYNEASFWTSSPTFFFLRLGILMLALAVAYALSHLWRGKALQEFGRASLFVYWIHVELVYGIFSAPIHRKLSFPTALMAFMAFTAAMFGLVRLKNSWFRGRMTESPQPAHR